jgi:hypothetical protein
MILVEWYGLRIELRGPNPLYETWQISFELGLANFAVGVTAATCSALGMTALRFASL